jgi:hypothetical protein
MNNAKLRALAQKLPSIPMVDEKGNIVQRVFMEGKYGHELLEANPDAKDKDGNPIKPKQRYVQYFKRTIPANHFENLSRIKKEKGMPGVKAYVFMCYKHNKMEIPEGLFDEPKPEPC